MRKINILNKKVLSIEDLNYINELNETNLPIRQIFKLLTNSSNEEVFKEIEEHLNNGEMIESFIANYLPKEIALYLVPLLSRLSFNESLKISLAFYFEEKKSEKTLSKAITYPIVLLFISLTALYLFDMYGLDSILQMLKTFNVDLSFYERLRIVFRILVYSFYFSFIIIGLLVIYFSSKKRIVLMYLFLSKYNLVKTLRVWSCSKFISLFLVCVELGYKTKESLEILKSMTSKPIISFLAFHMDKKLLDGGSLLEASTQEYYDETLSRFINIASYTNNFTVILDNYLELTKEKLEKKMKRITTSIQLITYGFIGMIIIFIYQILYLPMQALQGY